MELINDNNRRQKRKCDFRGKAFGTRQRWRAGMGLKSGGVIKTFLRYVSSLRKRRDADKQDAAAAKKQDPEDDDTATG